MMNVSNINDITDIKDVLSIIDPSLLYTTDHIILDSKYRQLNESGDTPITKFTFTYVHSKLIQSTTVNSGSPIENIAKIKIYSFTAPYGIELNEKQFSYARLAVAIEELYHQSYAISENVRAHWMLIKYETNPGNFQKRQEFRPDEFSDGVFEFHNNIKYLDKITIRLGSPTFPITYNHDRDTCTIASYGTTTDITTTYPHKFNFALFARTFISFDNFTTADTILDRDTIASFNSGKEILATVIDANTLRVSIDTSGVTPLLGMKFNVFYEERRIRIPMEITYIKENTSSN